MIKLSKQKAFSRILTFLVLQVLILGAVVNLNGVQVKAAAVTSTYIEDDADIFSDHEEEILTKEMKSIQKTYDMDVVILTVDGLNGQSAKGYIDDYVDAHCDAGLLSEDVVIALRDIDERWIQIRGYGKTMTYISDSRIETMYDDMTATLRVDNYYDAFSIFLDDVDSYLGRHPNPLTWTWIQVLLGLAIGGIITAVMVSQSKGKVTTDSRTYLDQANSGLVAKRDMYITTTVRRIHRPQAPSGGGGGGRSAGGRASSGGGGRQI
jgi:uncharacterized protein